MPPAATIPALVAQLRGSSRLRHASAVKALCALSLSTEHLATIRAADGIMPTLVARLRDGGTTVPAGAAALLLTIIWGSPEARSATLAAGAMPRLVSLLRGSGSGGASRRGSGPGGGGSSGSSSGSGVSGGSSERVQSTALMAILQLLGGNGAGTAALQAADGIAAVMPLLHSSANPELLAQAAAVLAEASVGSEEHTAAIIEAGAFDTLVPLLSSGSDEVQQFAALAFTNLAWGLNESNVAAVDAGCVPPLLRLLRALRPCQGAAAGAAALPE